MIVTLISCSSSGHQGFISEMNAFTDAEQYRYKLVGDKYFVSTFAYINDGIFSFKRVNDYRIGDNPLEHLGIRRMRPENIIKIETKTNGDLVYYFKDTILWKDKHCYYHVVVDNKTRFVKSWSFDYNKDNPKKYCGISG